MTIAFQGAQDVVIESIKQPGPQKKNFLSTSLNPLTNIPIAQRLILAFLIPTLIATLGSGLIGMQSAQLLNQESSFYQDLFQGYSSLSTGDDFLQLMNFKLNTTMNDAQASDQQGQVKLDSKAIQGLESNYDTLLNDYIKKDLLIYHSDQAQLFDTAGYPGQDTQQQILANSTLRTWKLYHQTQDQILQDLQNNRYNDAQTLKQTQGDVTYSDALSSLRQLIQFNGRLVTYVQGATAIQEQNALITTVIAVILVILSIGIIGALTYGTLVKRLRQLHEVAQAVQRGMTNTRAIVDGKDEITTVSYSMNTMLDTMVGLLEETQVQRDALVRAAERLFSDMRLANNGEIDLKAAVNNDPIGMLGHAFSFTVGRFRHFLVRNYSTIKQLDGISQRNQEHVDSFLTNMRNLLHSTQEAQLPSPKSSVSQSLAGQSLAGQSLAGQSSLSIRNKGENESNGNSELITQATRIQQYLRQTAQQDIEQKGLHLLSQVEQAYHLCHHVASELQSHNGKMTISNIQGVRSLETQLKELRKDAQIFQNKTAENLTEMDTKINNLLKVMRLIETTHTPHLTVAQVQELTRIAERFARDVTTLAQSLRMITQEMQSSLAPFRLEVSENG
jgi:HAMP domain-containing protein